MSEDLGETTTHGTDEEEEEENEEEQQQQQQQKLAGKMSSSSRTRKSSSRPKTLYQLAHPPLHRHLKRLRIRPRVLLQLQQTSHSPRPIPVLDVIPWYGFKSLIGHHRLPPSVIKARRGLSNRDLVIVRSELFEKTVSGILDKSWNYSDEAGERDDDDAREIVATVRQHSQGGGGAGVENARLKAEVEVRLVHGPAWEATVLDNGVYEFTANTRDGLQILRWVPRAAKKNSRTRGASVNSSSSEQAGKRFTFSVIDPSTRRHPVIASMTCSCIEVSDSYSKPASVFARRLSGKSDPSDDISRSVVETDDDLRTLIVVTGIWVAFKEGWSPIFSYRDGLTRSASTMTRSSSDSFRNNNNNNNDNDNNMPEDQEQTAPGVSSSTGGEETWKRELIIPKKSGSPRRSNSTGSALKERTDRRSFSSPTAAEGATADTQSKRHSSAFLSSGVSTEANPNAGGGVSFATPQEPPTDGNPRPRLSKVDLKSTNGRLERGLSTRSTPVSSRDVTPSPTTTKGKRHRRLSSLFYLFTKRAH